MSNETMLNIINAFIMLFLLISVGTNVILGWYIGKMNEKLKYAIQRHGTIIQPTGKKENNWHENILFQHFQKWWIKLYTRLNSTQHCQIQKILEMNVRSG
jgi:hypothetical protein